MRPDFALPLPRLMLISCLGALGLSAPVPNLPAIGVELRSSSAAGLAITMYLFVLGGGQLLCGSISDRVGRRRVLLVGLALFGLASFAAAFAVEPVTFLACRVLQAVGGCISLVVPRAMVADVLSDKEAASAMAYLSAALIVAPALAPMLGTVAELYFGWRGTFVGCALLALLLLPLARAVPETLPRAHRIARGGTASVYLTMLRRPRFVVYGATLSLATATFFVLLPLAPGLFVRELGMDATGLSLSMALLCLAVGLGLAISKRLLVLIGPDLAIAFGLTLMTVCGMALAVAAPRAWLLLLLLTLLQVGNGIVFPVAMSAAVSLFRTTAGAAAAFVGCMQLCVGAFTASALALVGWSGYQTVALAALAAPALALALLLIGGIKHKGFS